MEEGSIMSDNKKSASASINGCLSGGCKSQVDRFGFCKEHYEQFKFGLLKKDGSPVPDFEKKVEHYRAYVKKREAHKVA